MLIKWPKPRSNRTPIGMDIGRTGVRAVQLTRQGERFAITAAAQLDWAEDFSEGGDPSAFSGDRLRRCLRNGGFRGNEVVLGLNSPDVEFHALELPSAVIEGRENELTQVVHVEMQRLLDTMAAQMETRFWMIPGAQAHARSAVGVAARREAVLGRVARCDEAGLDCRSVDAAPAALTRFGALLSNWSKEGIWGILDLGHESSQLVLCADEAPVLVRQAGSSGQMWTDRIAEALQVSRNAAEIQKREHGIDFARHGDRSRHDDSSASEIASILRTALRPELRGVATEIKRSYEYVLSLYPGRGARDLVLVGGGAAARNLPEFFSDALAIPVRRAGWYLGECECRILNRCGGGAVRVETYATAIGLALGD